MKRIFILTILIISCSTQKVETPSQKKPSELVEVKSVKGKNLKQECSELKSTSGKEDSEYWESVATCYEAKKNHSQANFYHKIALSKDKSNEKSLYYLSQHYLKSKNYAKAYELLKSHDNLQIPKANLNLAILENYYGHFKDSNNALSKVLTEEKLKKKVLGMQALNFIGLKDFESAVVAYESIPKKYRYREPHKTNYLFTLLEINDYQKIRKLLSIRKVASSTSKNILWNELLTKAKLKIQELDEKKALEKQATKLNENLPVKKEAENG